MPLSTWDIDGCCCNCPPFLPCTLPLANLSVSLTGAYVPVGGSGTLTYTSTANGPVWTYCENHTSFGRGVIINGSTVTYQGCPACSVCLINYVPSTTCVAAGSTLAVYSTGVVSYACSPLNIKLCLIGYCPGDLSQLYITIT